MPVVPGVVVNGTQPETDQCCFSLAMVIVNQSGPLGYLGIVTLFRGWVDENADLIISPTGIVTRKMVNMGISSDRIIGPLFPINPKLKNFKIIF